MGCQPGYRHSVRELRFLVPHTMLYEGRAGGTHLSSMCIHLGYHLHIELYREVRSSSVTPSEVDDRAAGDV
jgi:hypothetical protein